MTTIRISSQSGAAAAAASTLTATPSVACACWWSSRPRRRRYRRRSPREDRSASRGSAQHVGGYVIGTARRVGRVSPLPTGSRQSEEDHSLWSSSGRRCRGGSRRSSRALRPSRFRTAAELRGRIAVAHDQEVDAITRGGAGAVRSRVSRWYWAGRDSASPAEGIEVECEASCGREHRQPPRPWSSRAGIRAPAGGTTRQARGLGPRRPFSVEGDEGLAGGPPWLAVAVEGVLGAQPARHVRGLAEDHLAREVTEAHRHVLPLGRAFTEPGGELLLRARGARRGEGDDGMELRPHLPRGIDAEDDVRAPTPRGSANAAPPIDIASTKAAGRRVESHRRTSPVPGASFGAILAKRFRLRPTDGGIMAHARNPRAPRHHPARRRGDPSARSRRPLSDAVAEEPARRGPIVDIRVRWRAGQVALGLAALMALVAMGRPLAPGARPASARGHPRSRPGGRRRAPSSPASRAGAGPSSWPSTPSSPLAVDGIGQVARPLGWPVWPLMALLVGGGGRGRAARPSRSGWRRSPRPSPRPPPAGTAFPAWKLALAAGLGYMRPRRRRQPRARSARSGGSRATLAELAQLQARHRAARRGGPRGPGAPGRGRARACAGLRGRPALAAARARGQELDRELAPARGGRPARRSRCTPCFYFEVDRASASRPTCAPPTAPRPWSPDCVVPLLQRPFAFVLERKATFYATDFKRLLWAFPYYKGEVKVGSLIAVPVRTGERGHGRARGRSAGGPGARPAASPRCSTASPASLAEAMIQGPAPPWAGRSRASSSRRSTRSRGAGRALASRERARAPACSSARDLVALEGAAVVMTDEAETRYTVGRRPGWATEFEGREVATLREDLGGLGAAQRGRPLPPRRRGGHAERDAACSCSTRAPGRGESLLARAPARAQPTLGALGPTGRRGTLRLGLPARARHPRQPGRGHAVAHPLTRSATRSWPCATGSPGSTTGAPSTSSSPRRWPARSGRRAASACSCSTSTTSRSSTTPSAIPRATPRSRAPRRALKRQLRKGDQAARYGGEEFVVILPAPTRQARSTWPSACGRRWRRTGSSSRARRLAVTASFGLAVWPGDGRKEPDALLASADRALYAAKQAGRNRVVVGGQPSAAASPP